MPTHLGLQSRVPEMPQDCLSAGLLWTLGSTFTEGTDGSVVAKFRVAGHNQNLKPGESLTTPMAFVGLFQGDLDEAGNESLDWQVPLSWDYTRRGMVRRDSPGGLVLARERAGRICATPMDRTRTPDSDPARCRQRFNLPQIFRQAD